MPFRSRSKGREALVGSEWIASAFWLAKLAKMPKVWMLSVHNLLDRKRSRDVDCLAGVVPFSVTWRARNERITVGNPGFLRSLRDPVYVGPQRDHGLS